MSLESENNDEPVRPLNWLRVMTYNGKTIIPAGDGQLWYWCNQTCKWLKLDFDLRDRLAVVGVDVSGFVLYEQITNQYYPHQFDGFRCTPEALERIEQYEKDTNTPVKRDQHSGNNNG